MSPYGFLWLESVWASVFTGDLGSEGFGFGLQLGGFPV